MRTASCKNHAMWGNVQEFSHAIVQPSTFPFSLNDFLLLKSLGSYIQNLQFIKTTCRIPGDRPND